MVESVSHSSKMILHPTWLTNLDTRTLYSSPILRGTWLLHWILVSPPVPGLRIRGFGIGDYGLTIEHLRFWAASGLGLRLGSGFRGTGMGTEALYDFYFPFSNDQIQGYLIWIVEFTWALKVQINIVYLAWHIMEVNLTKSEYMHYGKRSACCLLLQAWK